MLAAAPLLEIQDLRYRRAQARTASQERAFALRLPQLSLLAGTCVGLVGPSGCGKSTLVDLLALLRKPQGAACFRILDQDMVDLWERGGAAACTALRARTIGVVLQTGGLLPYLPVRDNVALSQRLLGMDDGAWIDHLLRALDLQALAGRLPSALSIGQRQRVAVARALAHKPALVLADEPTASLGVDHGPAVLDLLLGLCRSSATALVIVSHDVTLLRSRGVPLLACRSVEGELTFGAVD